VASDTASASGCAVSSGLRREERSAPDTLPQKTGRALRRALHSVVGTQRVLRHGPAESPPPTASPIPLNAFLRPDPADPLPRKSSLGLRRVCDGCNKPQGAMAMPTLVKYLRLTDGLYVMAGWTLLRIVLGWGLGVTLLTVTAGTAGLVYLRRIFTLGLPSPKNPKGAMAVMECVIC
jgi:hypothetical protein